jgi:hypothetical protein
MYRKRPRRNGRTRISDTSAARRARSTSTSEEAREVQHPQDEAVERLKDLIKEHGKWVEPIVEAVGA